MLKLDGLHKVTSGNSTKAGKPYINIFITKLTNQIQNGPNIDTKEQGVSARVFFNASNIDIDDLDKEYRAEICSARFMGIDKGTSDKQAENEENYTFKVYADYVRFVKFDNKEQEKEKPKNVKINTNNKVSKQEPKLQEDDLVDVDGDDEFN